MVMSRQVLSMVVYGLHIPRFAVTPTEDVRGRTQRAPRATNWMLAATPKVVARKLGTYTRKPAPALPMINPGKPIEAVSSVMTTGRNGVFSASCPSGMHAAIHWVPQAVRTIRCAGCYMRRRTLRMMHRADGCDVQREHHAEHSRTQSGPSHAD